MTRDMSQREFDAACRRYGFTAKGFCGYYDVGFAQVSIANAGPRRRDQLAYLIRKRDEFQKRFPSKS